MVQRSWSTAEIDILSKAAHSALLLPAASGVFTGMRLAAAVTGNRTGSPESNAREAGMTHSQTSAIYHATGRRIRDLPITPAKLLTS